jgi:hypothetical protein
MASGIPAAGMDEDFPAHSPNTGRASAMNRREIP